MFIQFCILVFQMLCQRLFTRPAAGSLLCQRLGVNDDDVDESVDSNSSADQMSGVYNRLSD